MPQPHAIFFQMKQGDAIEHITRATNIEEAHRIALLSQQASGEERHTSTQPSDELTYGQDVQYPQAPQVQPGRRRSHRRHVDVPIPNHTLCDPVPPPLSLHHFAISSINDDAGPSQRASSGYYTHTPNFYSDAGSSQHASQRPFTPWGSTSAVGFANYATPHHQF